VVCDAGLPIPPGPEVVDLAFRFGVPTFETVLSGLLEELVVEGATAAEEVERTPTPTSSSKDACRISASSRTKSSSAGSPGRSSLYAR
jgi:D-ribose pyranase